MKTNQLNENGAKFLRPLTKPCFVTAAVLGVMLACAPMSRSAEDSHPAVAAPAAETPAQRDARMKWFNEARFGMFIHWGLYSVPAGVYHGSNIGDLGEWIQNKARIPTAEYRKYAEQFNPTNFSADAIAKLAKDAGMKYIVITAKHHDGFAMFKSSDPFNIVDATPFKRDVIKELADAARKQGLHFGVYYSQNQDWNHPGGAVYGNRWDPTMDGSFDEYLHAVAIPQVRELLTNIRPEIFWWDTPSGTMTPERAKLLHDLLALRSGIIVNDRLGGGYSGDTETPEGYIPATGYPSSRKWEVCMTLNDTWGYKSTDHHYKSAQELIRNLVDIASKGGNYLLNIGPTATGEVPQPQVERLLAVGRWTKINGESIYATTANPLPKAPSWGRITQKPGKLFLHVFDWPKDGKLSIGIGNEIKKAYLLADAGVALKTTSADSGVTVALPATAPDPVDSVVVLEYSGEVEVAPITQAADGSLTLTAADAEIIGSQAKLEGDDSHVAYWTDPKDFVQWQARIKQPGDFAVSVDLACDPGSTGSTYKIAIGDSVVEGNVESTGGWQSFKTVNLGKLHIGKSGPATVSVNAVSKPGEAVMNLRRITLTPIK